MNWANAKLQRIQKKTTKDDKDDHPTQLVSTNSSKTHGLGFVDSLDSTQPLMLELSTEENIGILTCFKQPGGRSSWSHEDWELDIFLVIPSHIWVNYLGKLLCKWSYGASYKWCYKWVTRCNQGFSYL